MVLGIIIDAFAELRKRTEDMDDKINNLCAICCLDRRTIESGVAGGFAHHRSEEHNPFSYFYFLVHLREKKGAWPTLPPVTLAMTMMMIEMLMMMMSMKTTNGDDDDDDDDAGSALLTFLFCVMGHAESGEELSGVESFVEGKVAADDASFFPTYQAMSLKRRLNQQNHEQQVRCCRVLQYCCCGWWCRSFRM